MAQTNVNVFQKALIPDLEVHTEENTNTPPEDITPFIYATNSTEHTSKTEVVSHSFKNTNNQPEEPEDLIAF